MNDSTPEKITPEISKSQRKRDAHELLDLAKALIKMPESRLRKMPMDEDLSEAIYFTRSIRSNGARKRQLMTVGKMLRNRDNAFLIDAVNGIDQKNREQNVHFHRIEAWRDRLLEGGDNALSELLEMYPAANPQTFRQLIRNANKEEKLGKPPVAARKLFKLLRDSDNNDALPPLP